MTFSEKIQAIKAQNRREQDARLSANADASKLLGSANPTTPTTERSHD